MCIEFNLNNTNNLLFIKDPITPPPSVIACEDPEIPTNDTASNQPKKNINEISKCISSNSQAIESNNIWYLFKLIQADVILKNTNKVEHVFKQFIDKLSKIDLTAKAGKLDREQKLQVYRNITYIKEHSFDIENVELTPLLEEKEKMGKQLCCMDRISKESLPILSLGAKTISSSDVDKEILHVRARYQKMRAAVEEYYKKFDFTSDEVSSPAFQSLTLEGRFPKRKHLMMFAEDLLQGAVNIIERSRNSQRKIFFQECQQLCAKQALSLPKEIQELSWEKIKQNILELKAKGLLDIIEKFDKIEIALNHFLKVIKEKHLFVRQDKRLGNNDPNQQLAKDELNWKKQMKEADQAIVEIAESLKAAYVNIGTTTGEFSSDMNHDAKIKAAGAILTKARDDILNSKERWSTPIDTTIRFPSYKSSSECKSSTLRHVMVCPNAGYASSAFRGRKDSQLPIQPNWWNVQLQIQTAEGQGLRTVEFSRSAIQVEFMSEDQKKTGHGNTDRMQATQRQVLEVLSEKAVRRFKKSPPKKGIGLSKEKPLRLDITEVSLMTPDTVRSLLVSDPKLGRLAKEISGWTTDASGWERRMMQENHDAWLFFDASNSTAWKEGPPDSFCYTHNNGDRREVIVHLEKEPDPKVVYEIIYSPVKGEKMNLFVQFDIAFYNGGCSERTKMMTHFTSKEEIAQKLQLLCKALADKVSEHPDKNTMSTSLNTVEVVSKLSEAVIEFGKENSLTKRRNVSNSSSDHFLSRGFSKFKNVLLNGTKIFSQVLINEKLSKLKYKLETDPKTSQGLLELAKTSISHFSSKELTAIAHAIPDEVLIEDNVGLERLCELSFPFIKTLLTHETGRHIIEVFAANFGKKITVDELAEVKLPDAFTSEQDKLLGSTNLLEDKINKNAFAKHQRRVNARLLELEAQRSSLSKEIIKNSSAESMIKKIDDQVNVIKVYREELLKSEIAYSTDKLEDSDQKRNLAFVNWQKARDQLGRFIQEEPSADVKAYFEIIRYEDNLIALCDEVSDQLTFQAFRDLNFMRKNMYSLPSKIVALSIYLDEDPHTGCRSGKDRTAMQDMEISTIFALEALNGRIPNYREMEEDLLTLDVREAVLLDSGQIDDLAFRNIGSYGLNLSGSYGTYLSGFRQLGKLWEQTITGGVWETFRKNY